MTTDHNLQQFTKIMGEWKVNPEKERLLLGDTQKQKRIRFVLDIHECLDRLFPDEERARQWVNRKNSVLNDETAIEYMSSNGIEGIERVQKYLRAQLVG